VESETMDILCGDKVPLGDNKGCHLAELYLRHDSVHFNESSFLTSMLASKGLCSYIWIFFTKIIHQPLNRSSYHLSSPSLFSAIILASFDPYHRGVY